jgi:hypothetical protein
MWKKLVLCAGLLACLGLPAFAPAAEAADVAKKTIPVELKGKLQRLDVRLEPADRNPFSVVWQLLVDGQAYDLDFDNKHDLWVLAEKNVGQTVRVKGTWDGAALHVASMTADPEYVKKTVKVEVKGRLGMVCPPIYETPVRPVAYETPVRPAAEREPYDFLPPAWQLYVNDTAYALVFDDNSLAARANELVGRTVTVTGVQADDGIQVATLKADDEYLKVTQTDIEIKGKLRYVLTMWDTGKVVMVCDRLPEAFAKCWIVNYGFEIDGQVYVLDFHGDKWLQKNAGRYLGHTVTAAGTLSGDRVKVDRLECDDLGALESLVPWDLPAR